MPPGCLVLLLFLGFVFMLPFLLADAFLGALAKLGLSPVSSLIAAVGMFLGGLVNIPVRRYERHRLVEAPAFGGLFGLGRFFPQRMVQRSHLVIAVNVGGCVIPVLLVLYQLTRLAAYGGNALLLTAVATVLNIGLCYRLARPVPHLGIALPALVPAFAAALCGLLLLPEFAPPLAFTAGVLGPLVGADLMHVREFDRIESGVVSIGGAGTFDGIVLSGFVAAILS